MQSRCYILDNIHGGLTPAALASECERLPTKLRLLRCTTHTHQERGGVSPPWFAVTHVQGRGAIVRETSDRRTGERQRSYGTTTPTAGSRPPLLCRVNRCLLVRGDFFCTRVLLTTAGSRPPLLRRNANVCRRNCGFCDGRTRVHQERGCQPPVVHGNALARASRQCRCDCRPCISGPRRSRATTPTTTPTAGSRPPLLCRSANVCRRSCDFCDARTHMHQERGASAPRGLR
jgi:hypothetical protein